MSTSYHRKGARWEHLLLASSQEENSFSPDVPGFRSPPHQGAFVPLDGFAHSLKFSLSCELAESLYLLGVFWTTFDFSFCSMSWVFSGLVRAVPNLWTYKSFIASSPQFNIESAVQLF